MNVLDQVLTIPEVARCWRKNKRTVERAIDAGRYPLIARQESARRGAWLIDRASVVRRWGDPVIDVSDTTYGRG